MVNTICLFAVKTYVELRRRSLLLSVFQFQRRYNNNNNNDGLEFIGDLGRRITQVTDDIRESAFLFQRLSVLIQRYNVVAIQGTFVHTTSEDEL